MSLARRTGLAPMSDQPQVSPNMKPAPKDCQCGCGASGQLRTSTYRDGSRHVRRCACSRCRGLRSKRKGQRGQAAASTGLGMPRSSIRPGHEELAGGTVRWEHKQGAQAGPVITRYRLSRAQSEAERSTGDHRPFVATFGHDGVTVAVIDLEHLPEAVAALAEQLGMA